MSGGLDAATTPSTIEAGPARAAKIGTWRKAESKGQAEQNVEVIKVLTKKLLSC